MHLTPHTPTPKPPPRAIPNRTRKTRELNINLLRMSGMPKYRVALHTIMARGKVPWGIKLKPEERICIEFADKMRTACLDERYKGIWSHIANEGKRHPLVALVMIAMGMLPGSPDHFFIWRTATGIDAGVIEFKSEDGTLSPAQKCYRDLCEHYAIKHTVCKSAESGMQVLEEWGAFV